jgi:hypothetical protein
MYTLKEINNKLRNGSFTERNVAMAILADYAEAEEQGLLIKLPCKPDSIVYWIWTVEMREPIITEHTASLKFIIDNLNKFGIKIFTTREEAEKALKKSICPKYGQFPCLLCDMQYCEKALKGGGVE